MLLKDSKYVSKKIGKYIQSKIDELSELPDVYKYDESDKNYNNINPKEIDLYYFMDSDVYKMLINDLPKYITTHHYFFNIIEKSDA